MKTGQAPSDAALYILGLGLVALSMQPESFLRQGCLLVADGALDCRVVLRDGREQIVYSWEVPPPKTRLAPGESVTVNEAVTDVPRSAKFAEIGWKPN